MSIIVYIIIIGKMFIWILAKPFWADVNWTGCIVCSNSYYHHHHKRYPPPSHPTLWAANPTVLKPPSKSNYHPLVHLSEAASCSSLKSHTNMSSLFLVIVALTQIGRTMGIVDNLDKKEVVLGIMSNICPLLGEFNTPLGAEGEILSVRWPKSGQKPRQIWQN